MVLKKRKQVNQLKHKDLVFSKYMYNSYFQKLCYQQLLCIFCLHSRLTDFDPCYTGICSLLVQYIKKGNIISLCKYSGSLLGPGSHSAITLEPIPNIMPEVVDQLAEDVEHDLLYTIEFMGNLAYCTIISISAFQIILATFIFEFLAFIKAAY